MIGCDSSSIRALAFAFFAASLTLNASGLNCTLSIVSRTMGVASSFILGRRSSSYLDISGERVCGIYLLLATAFLAALLTLHSTFLHG